LNSVTDAKKQTTLYEYFKGNNLLQVSYSNAVVATPTVSFTPASQSEDAEIHGDLFARQNAVAWETTPPPPRRRLEQRIRTACTLRDCGAF
jgi:hypothetical protein